MPVEFYLAENTLYTTDAERQDIIKDPQKVGNIFAFNFLGVLALYQISHRRGRMRGYLNENPKLRLQHIGHENTDMSIAIKMAHEAGGLTSSTANQLTRLMAKMKGAPVDILDEPIRELMSQVKWNSIRPSTKIKFIVESFINKEISLGQAGKALGEIAKKFKKDSGDFRDLRNSYLPILKKIPDTNTTAPDNTITTAKNRQSADITGSASTSDSAGDTSADRQTSDVASVNPSEDNNKTIDHGKDKTPKPQLSVEDVFAQMVRAKGKRELDRVLEAANYSAKDVFNDKNIETIIADRPDTIFPLTEDWEKGLGSYLSQEKLNHLLAASVVYCFDNAIPPGDVSVEHRIRHKELKRQHRELFRNTLEIAKSSNIPDGIVRFYWMDRYSTTMSRSNFVNDTSYIDVLKWVKANLGNPTPVDEYDNNGIVHRTLTTFMLSSVTEKHGYATRLLIKLVNYTLIPFFLNSPANDVKSKGMEKIESYLESQISKEDLHSFTSYPLPLHHDGMFSGISNVSEIINELEQAGFVGKQTIKDSETLLAAVKSSTGNIKINMTREEAISYAITTNEFNELETKLSREDVEEFAEYVYGPNQTKAFVGTLPDSEKAFVDAVSDISSISTMGTDEVAALIVENIRANFLNTSSLSNYSLTGPFIPILVKYGSEETKTKYKNFMAGFFATARSYAVHSRWVDMSKLEARVPEFFRDNFSNLDTSNLTTDFTNVPSIQSPLTIQMFIDRVINNVTSLEDTREVLRNMQPYLAPDNISQSLSTRDSFKPYLDKLVTAFKEKIEKLDTSNLETIFDKFSFSGMPEVQMSMLLMHNSDYRERTEQTDKAIDHPTDVIESRAKFQRILKVYHSVKITKGANEQIRQRVLDMLGNLVKRIQVETRVHTTLVLAPDTGSLYEAKNDIVKYLLQDSETKKQVMDIFKNDDFQSLNKQADATAAERIRRSVENVTSSNLLEADDYKEILNSINRSTKVSRKRDFKDEMLELTADTFSKVIDDGVLGDDAVNEAFKASTPTARKRIDRKVISGALLERIGPELKNAPIVPNMELDRESTMKLLEFNNIHPDEVVAPDPSIKKYELTKRTNHVRNGEIDFQKINVGHENKDENQEDIDLDRLSAEYHALYFAGRHGRIAAKFTQVFTVNIQKQIDGTEKFLEAYPDTEVLDPTFHGTGSVAASMILRFGFATVSEDDSGPINIAGKMMGEGIYVSNKLDKVLQYASDAGYQRRVGDEGYIFECRTFLGNKGETYEAAGVGDGDKIRSPEWVVRLPNQQIRITRAYKVVRVDQGEMDDLVQQYRLIKENKTLNVSNFRYFLTEAKTLNNDVEEFIFYRGLIPTPDGDVAEIDEIDRSKLVRGAKVEPSAKGPVIAIPSEQSDRHHIGTLGQEDPATIERFLKMAFKG